MISGGEEGVVFKINFESPIYGVELPRSSYRKEGFYLLMEAVDEKLFVLNKFCSLSER